MGLAGAAQHLDLDQKAALTAGHDWWHLPATPDPALPTIKVSDGPVGARGARATGGPPSACFPCGSALAATWDIDLVQRVGAALGREAKSKGAHVLLAPTINLHRTPLGGRHFECYSEDPYLTARIAVAYVQGVQSERVGACVKHFVCNDAETDRFTVSVDVDDRTLREVYLAPFEAALLEAGAWSVMGAYNRLRGDYCCESELLLTRILRDEWGWDGVVISDWGATHSTLQAARAGLDIEMPGPPRWRGSKLADAVRAGEVEERDVDATAERVLLLAKRVGAELGAPPPSERWDDDPKIGELAREAAAAAIVLLRNEGGVLPLDDGATVALIGPAAVSTHALGGGSARVTPPYVVSIAEALTARLPATQLRVEPGCVVARGMPEIPPTALRRRDGEAGADVEWFASRELGGAPVSTGTVASARLGWSGQVEAPPEGWSARLSADLIAETSGLHTIRLRTSSRGRCWIGEDVLLDAWENAELDARGRATAAAEVHLVAGEPVSVRMEFAAREGVAAPGAELRWQPPPEAEADLLARAVEAARASDVAVVAVGLGPDWETEGRDRADLRLPGGQDDLVRAVAATNAKTVVVVNAGGPIEMPWVSDVAAIVWLWYPGQEAGNAMADVLLGAVDASGRLPTTFPVRLEDALSPQAAGSETVVYDEGVFVGHRRYEAAGVAPLFPFGHGLSFAQFDYGPLEVEVQGRSARVTAEVRNVGVRAGSEVVQVYVSDPVASVLRPPKELKSFAKVRLERGESRQVELTLDERAFSFWGENGWEIEAGDFEILVGRSSADIRARAAISIR